MASGLRLPGLSRNGPEAVLKDNKLMRVFSPLVPAAGFTQRATIDPELNEIHVLSVSTVFPDSVVYS